MTPLLATVHREVVERAPPGLREGLDWLPRTLGVSTQRGGWVEYARLAPIIGLPRFFDLPKSTRPRAVRRHVLGGFWGLTLDREADGQSLGGCSTELRHLEALWHESFVEVVGLEQASRVLADCRLSFEAGVCLERTLFALRRASLVEYATCLWLRTGWFSASTLVELERHSGARELALAERGIQELMLSLQFLDDAVDLEEDRSARGLSWPELLGQTRADFTFLSVHFASRAAETLSAAGVPLLSRWARLRAAHLWRLTPHAQRIAGPMLLLALDVNALHPRPLWSNR
ncbi:MAG: hypothetical protein ABTQ32_10395 [Myxococcaceae bacterium]